MHIECVTSNIPTNNFIIHNINYTVELAGIYVYRLSFFLCIQFVYHVKHAEHYQQTYAEKTDLSVTMQSERDGVTKQKNFNRKINKLTHFQSASMDYK